MRVFENNSNKIFIAYPYLLAVITVVCILSIDKVTYGFVIDKKGEFNNDANQLIDTPFILPFNGVSLLDNTKLIQNHPGILDPETQTSSPVKQKSSNTLGTTTTCNGAPLDDTFKELYTLQDGQISPNGKWQNIYNGFGSSGVESADRNHVFFLKPKISTSTSETHAALVKSTQSFCDFVVDFDSKTVKQLRQNSPAKAWEVGWFIFRYTDTFHYYWFLLKPNGIEMGKKDCDTCTNSKDGQQFLVTENSPTLQLNKWSHWKISMIGNHIVISINGVKVIDFIDTTMSPKLSSGNIAMYSEDAYVRYDNMHLQPQ